MRILFVCLGNICRSPSAEGVARARAAALLKSDHYVFDSAGTGEWHAGDPPDPRAVSACAARGVDISGQRARQLSNDDFRTFDLILAMDQSNLSEITRRNTGGSATIRLLLDYAPHSANREVPDPYYGGDDGFEHMLDLLENAMDGLFERTGRPPRAL